MMAKNYFFRPFDFQSPVSCFGCPKYIYGEGQKLILSLKIQLPYHTNCAKRVEKSIDQGFLFAKPRPILIMIKKVEKDTTIKIQAPDDELPASVLVKAGDYIAIDVDGTKRIITAAEYERNYSTIEKIIDGN